MGSPFYYRVQVRWSKKGKYDAVDNCQIYAFKPGDGSSGWLKSISNINDLKMISLGADGARMFTVCTHTVDAYRYLEDRSIDGFIVNVIQAPTYKHIDISHYVPPPPDRVLAQISFPSMVSSKKIMVDRKQINMSCEPLPMQLFAVTMDFHDADGGPTFTLT